MIDALVLGVGPGIGTAVARRFAREGGRVGVVARSRANVDAAAATVDGAGGEPWAATADVTDEAGLRAVLERFADEVGVPDVLVYNAAIVRTDEPGDISADEHLARWAVNVVGAITAASVVLPRMAERGRGTLVVTSGMAVPDPALTSLSLGKAGVRALVELLHTRFGPSGVHVASVTVTGPVAPGTTWDPDEIAERYADLHAQGPGDWEREVVHGPLP